MLKNLCARSYKLQSIWFLNAFFDKIEDPENFWKYVEKLVSLDLPKGAEGNELDELQMHRFLEFFKETMTVTEMRDILKSTGAITGITKLFPITHYYINKYKIDWHKLVNAAQGDNKAEIEEAERRLNEVGEAFKACEASAEAAKIALKDSEAREADAKSREAEAKAAQQELEAALRELKAQEDAFNNKTKDLTTKSEDEGASGVSRNKAKAELAQHLASDPLPLRKAKTTQEAAVRKAEKATKAAADARSAAEASRAKAEQAKAAAEAAVDEMQVKVEEAEAYLREVKSKPGVAQGMIWWMERELYEKKKYMPSRKGGIAK